MYANKKFLIQGEAGLIDCQMRLTSSPKAIALLAHPHPLYGGSMDNPLIYRSAAILQEAQIPSLRFNFRGVGRSEGAHTEGPGEIADLETCMRWFRGLLPKLPLLVIGYSFGAWCIAESLKGAALANAFIAIGLPLEKYNFHGLQDLEMQVGIVQGEFDEFGTFNAVEKFIEESQCEAKLSCIANSDHLFSGKSQEAAEAVGHLAETFAQTCSGDVSIPRSHTP